MSRTEANMGQNSLSARDRAYNKFKNTIGKFHHIVTHKQHIQ